MNKRLIAKITVAALMGVVVLMTAPGALAQMYNASPVWKNIGNLTVNQGNTLSVSVSAIDEGGDYLTYAAVNLPEGSVFNPATQIFSFAPGYSQLGSFPVTLSVTDGKSAPVYKTFYVGVTSNYSRVIYGGGQTEGYINQAPYINANNSYYAVLSGGTVDFRLSAVDPEGSPIFYSVSNLPVGASFNQNSGQFTWSPVRGQRGVYTVKFTVSDGSLTGIPFNVTISVDGGTAVVNQTITTPTYQPVSTPVQTVSAPTRTIVRYVTVPASTKTSVNKEAVAPANNQNVVYVNTAQTITQAPYQQGQGMVHTGTGPFNIKMQVGENQETVVSWDTNQPAKGEVVFGYSSQPSTRVLNYEFTTGQAVDFSTSHQMSLGSLQMNRTYYLRIISRTGGATNIGDELIFIPMPYAEQQAVSQTVVGATASSIDAFGGMLSSGWLLLILMFIIFALVIYLLATPAHPAYQDTDLVDEGAQSIQINAH